MTTNYTTSEFDLEETDTVMIPKIAEFKRKSVSGAISYTLRSIFLNIFSVVTSLIIGYYLLPEDFGVYGIVAQIIGLLQFFSTVGLGPTLIQKKLEPTLQEYRTVFTVQQVLSWIIVLVAILINASGLLDAKIGFAGQMVFLALALSFPLDSLKIISAIMLERKLDFSKLVLPSVVEQVVYNSVLLTSVIVFQSGVISYAYAIFARGITGCISMYVIQSWPIGLAWEKSVIRTILKTGLQFQASDLLSKVKDQLFYLLLGFFLPLKEFGYISWAKTWSQFPYNLTVQNVVAITFPAYSRLQHDKNLLKKAIEKTIYFISISIYPMLAIMAVYITPFTQIVVKYQKWQPALFTFILFTFSIGWASISTPLTNSLSAIGQVHKTLQLVLMWTVLTWILTPLFIWLWGFNGVAVAAFVISFSSIMPIIFVRKYVVLNIFWQVKDALLATIVMLFFSILSISIWRQGLPQLCIGILMSVLVYLIILLLIGKTKLVSELKSLISTT